MATIAGYSHDGRLSLKGHKAKPSVLCPVHTVPWHIYVHNIPAQHVQLTIVPLNVCAALMPTANAYHNLRQQLRQYTCSSDTRDEHICLRNSCDQQGCYHRHAHTVLNLKPLIM